MFCFVFYFVGFCLKILSTLRSRDCISFFIFYGTSKSCRTTQALCSTVLLWNSFIASVNYGYIFWGFFYLSVLRIKVKVYESLFRFLGRKMLYKLVLFYFLLLFLYPANFMLVPGLLSSLFLY